MKIELFEILGVSVKSYGLMIAIGLVMAMLVGTIRARKKKLNDELIIDIAIIAAISGFAGAKLLYVIVEWKQFIANPLEALGSSGFVVYGGIIMGTVVCILYCRYKKVNVTDYFDLVMPEIAIAQGFGRIGCFMAGCCYGARTDAWYGVVFPSSGMAPSGVKLIPTQLISAAGDFAIAIVLVALADSVIKKNDESRGYGQVSGDIGATYLIMYGIGRFLIEFLRNDYRGAVGFMSTSQFISIFIVLAGVGIMAVTRLKHRTA